MRAKHEGPVVLRRVVASSEAHDGHHGTKDRGHQRRVPAQPPDGAARPAELAELDLGYGGLDRDDAEAVAGYVLGSVGAGGAPLGGVRGQTGHLHGPKHAIPGGRCQFRAA